MLKKLHYQPPANGCPEWNNNPEIFMLGNEVVIASDFKLSRVVNH